MPSRPEMAHNLPDRVEMQPGAFDMFDPFDLGIGTESSKDCFCQDREIVTRHCLARRNGDIVPTDNRKDPTAHGAEMPRPVAAFPSDDGDRKARQEIGVLRQNPEAAGSIFGAQSEHAVFIDDDREWRNDAQPHCGRSFLAEADSFWRASSKVPTM